MANFLYTLYKQAILEGVEAIDLEDDTIKADLFRSSAYTPNQSTDEFYDDIGASAVATATLNITVAGNNVDAVDFSYSSVAAGAEIDLLVIWKDTGTPGTSRLIAKYDISVTPNGNDIDVTVNGSGLFDL